MLHLASDRDDSPLLGYGATTGSQGTTCFFISQMLPSTGVTTAITPPLYILPYEMPFLLLLPTPQSAIQIVPVHTQIGSLLAGTTISLQY